MRTPASRIFANNPRGFQPVRTPIQKSWLPTTRKGIKVTRVETPAGAPMGQGSGIVPWVKQHPIAAGALAVGGFLVLPGLIFSTIAIAAKLAFYGAIAVGGVFVVGKVIGKIGGGGGGGSSGNGNYRL